MTNHFYHDPMPSLIDTNVKVKQLDVSTYNTLSDVLNLLQGRAVISGAIIIDNGDTTISVTSGYGYCKESNDDLATTILIKWDTVSTISLTDNTRRAMEGRSPWREAPG